jgi:hypothetical protein
MLALAVGGQTEGRNVLVGEEFGAAVRGAAANAPLSIVGPDSKSETVRPALSGDESRWAYTATLFSGMYEARPGERSGSTQTFAVNVDPVESDLTRVDPDLLPGQFQQDLRAGDEDPPKLPGGKPWPLYRVVLGLVLTLVLTETFLAWLFGKTSA